MSNSLLEADSHTRLLNAPDDGGKYLYSRIFQYTGVFANGKLKNKFKILKNIDSFLQKILQPEEKVFYISYGVLNTLLEQIFVGWVAYYLNRKAFVFTSRRLILVQLKGKHKTWDLKSTIEYASIRQLKRTWTGQLRIKLHNGKSFSFTAVPKGDRKFISTVIQGLIDNFRTEKNMKGVNHLCPACGVAVEGRPLNCPVCGGRFKSASKAAWLSLAFPGLGDLYLGHRGLAILEMLGAAVLWVSIFIPDPKEPLSPVALAVVAGVLFVFLHCTDSLVTRYIARKGIYPG